MQDISLSTDKTLSSLKLSQYSFCILGASCCVSTGYGLYIKKKLLAVKLVDKKKVFIVVYGVECIQYMQHGIKCINNGRHYLVKRTLLLCGIDRITSFKYWTTLIIRTFTGWPKQLGYRMQTRHLFRKEWTPGQHQVFFHFWLMFRWSYPLGSMVNYARLFRCYCYYLFHTLFNIKGINLRQYVRFTDTPCTDSKKAFIFLSVCR